MNEDIVLQIGAQVVNRDQVAGNLLLRCADILIACYSDFFHRGRSSSISFYNNVQAR